MTDPFDARIAVGATPLLATFNAAGILSAADVHVAQRLGRLTGEADERVHLAVALAVRAVRAGSVCVELADAAELARPEGNGGEEARPDTPVEPVELPWPDPTAWLDAVARSPLVAEGPGHVDRLDDPGRPGGLHTTTTPVDRPVRLVHGRLYLDRYWRAEQAVRAEVDRRLRVDIPVPYAEVLRAAVHRVFPVAPSPSTVTNARQRVATATCAAGLLTVLTGGPGTGKTTTVARLLAVLQETTGPGLRVALAAPTGKAAARLTEAVQEALAGLGAEDRQRVGSLEASTVHRLLGWRPGSSTRFRHHRDHHLPHDVVVVDETSMVSLPLMARLLEALRPDARLLLVGDPDQLASVEAGAVLGDLVVRPPVADRLPGIVASVLPDEVRGLGADRRSLANGVVELVESHRFDDAIGDLAHAIRGAPAPTDPSRRTASADTVLEVLRSGRTEIELVEPADGHVSDGDLAGLRADAVASGVALVEAARAGDARAALTALGTHRLLLAHRHGAVGVSAWARTVETWVGEATGVGAPGSWYAGQPLLVTANDRDTGLYNGDTGVVVDDGAGGLTAVFGDPGSPRAVRPHRLPAVQTVHAMTVHRGQGSQFDRVTVLLPPAASPLLTRELLYTAVTRARTFVRLIGTEEAVRAAVERPIRRASGLRIPLTP